MDVIVILRGSPDSWNPGTPSFCAVASDEEAAKRWIENETTNSSTGHRYAQGVTADEWIKYGTFILRSNTIQE